MDTSLDRHECRVLSSVPDWNCNVMVKEDENGREGEKESRKNV